MRKSLAGLMIAALAVGSANAQGRVVNVLNWSDYIAEGTIKAFEAETGITVTYDVMDSNEMLETKLLSGQSGYDVVFPSLIFMARQIAAGAYQPLQKGKLPNLGNLDPDVMELLQASDPGNTYGVPYMEYTTGIGYNKALVEERIGADKVGTWDMLFDPETVAKLKDCGVAVVDAPAHVIPAALNYLGLPPDSKDTDHLAQAADLVNSVRPNIRYFHSSRYINDLAQGEICAVLGWSGDILQARDRAAEAGHGVTVGYALPASGARVGFDMMGIPADAPHPEEGLAFINFLLRPEIIAEITDYVYYANPNTAANDLVSDEVINDPGIYPPAEIREGFYVLTPNDPRYSRELNRAWTQIRTGN